MTLPDPSKRREDGKTLRIGLVGSVPPPLGGVTVLFKGLLDHVDSLPGVDSTVVEIPVGPLGIRGRVRGLVRVLRGVARALPDVDVLTLHVPTPLLPVLAPFCRRLCRRSGTPLIVRKFGGTDYRTLGPLRARVSRWVVRHVDVYLAETKALVAIARAQSAPRAEWFPNNRPLSRRVETRPKDACKKFVYLGQVRRVKGVLEIVAAGNRLADDLTIDIYGPLYDGLTPADLEAAQVTYRGVVAPESSVEVLSQYDALLLPTYHPGEGYPGVVLEAYLAGLPVICSRWKDLPEIVDESSGLFVAPRDVESLLAAINRLAGDPALYERLRAGARARAEMFSTEVWSERFVALCREIVAGARGESP